MIRLVGAAVLMLALALQGGVADASTPAAHAHVYVLYPTGTGHKWGHSIRPARFDATVGPTLAVRQIRWIHYTNSEATGRARLVACDTGCFGPHGRITFRLYRVRSSHHIRYFTRLHFYRTSTGIPHTWEWSWSAAEWVAPT